MREGGKGLRRLGFAALFMFAASAATAQTQELAIGQRNLACGSPTSLNDGWPTTTPESVGLDGSRLCGIAAKLAATYLALHLPGDAVLEYGRALALSPGRADLAQLHMGRGQALATLQLNEAALTDFEQALAISPCSQQARAALNLPPLSTCLPK